jgi:hypothetical protein
MHPPQPGGPLQRQGLGDGSRQRQLEDLGLRRDDTIVTESARTVDFNGQAVVPRYVYTELDKGDQELTVQTAATRVVFGLGRDVTAGLTVPYVHKVLRRTNPITSLRETLRSDGLGDATATAKYRFFQDAGPGETTEGAALFGLELPTGRADAAEDGARLPQPLQPGSGSVDAILGAAFTRVDGRWQVNADAIGKLNSQADGYRFGNTYRADAGVQLRLHPARYTSFDQATVNLIAELNAVFAERDAEGGATVLDSGGLKVFATPGVQVIASDCVLLEAAVSIPVYRALHGSQLEESFQTILGMRARF